VVYRLETFAIWPAGVLPGVAAEIAPGNSGETSFEVAGETLADTAIPGRANDAPDIHPSILQVLFHEKMEGRCSIPNPSGNPVSDTSALPMGATTNRRKRRGPWLNQGQRRHLYQAGVPLLAVPQPQSGEAGERQFVL
jgi:hypothetical protein